MLFSSGSQFATGCGMSGATSICWVKGAEVHPFSVIVSVIVLLPLAGQMMLCGPGPVPGIAVPLPKFQLKTASVPAPPV